MIHIYVHLNLKYYDIVIINVFKKQTDFPMEHVFTSFVQKCKNIRSLHPILRFFNHIVSITSRPKNQLYI